MDVAFGLAAWVVLLGGAILLRAKLGRVGVAVGVVGVTVLLAAALIGLALTDSPVFGWISFGSVFLYAMGRFALGAFGDDDGFA